MIESSHRNDIAIVAFRMVHFCPAALRLRICVVGILQTCLLSDRIVEVRMYQITGNAKIGVCIEAPEVQYIVFVLVSVMNHRSLVCSAKSKRNK